MPTKKPPKPLSVRELDLIAYIIDHPDMSQSACAEARGYKGGYISTVLKRIRPELEARLRREAAAVEKASIERKVVTRSIIEDGVLGLAQLNPSLTKDNITGQVAAYRLLAEMGGHIVQKTADVSAMFKDWTEAELDTFARTREIPERFSRGSGDSGPVV